MYLYSNQAYIKQIMPPHWRGSWREYVLLALTKPILSIEKRLRKYAYELTNEVNVSSQFLVLQEYLKNITNSQLSYIVDGHFVVSFFVPVGTDLYKIHKLAERYLFSGVKIKIKIINQ